MKKLIFLFFLVACAEDQLAPVKPVHTSIEGRWRFETKDVSGEFEIVNYSGKMTVNNAIGDYFILKGKRYDVTTKREVEGLPPKLMTFFIVGDKTSVTFRDLDVDKTYENLTTYTYDYVIGTEFVQVKDKITITR